MDAFLKYSEEETGPDQISEDLGKWLHFCLRKLVKLQCWSLLGLCIYLKESKKFRVDYYAKSIKMIFNWGKFKTVYFRMKIKISKV